MATQLAPSPTAPTPLFPASGIALAAVLVWRWQGLAAVAAGAAALAVTAWRIDGMPAGLAGALWLGSVVQAAIGALLVRRTGRRPLTLEDAQSIIQMNVLGGAAAGIVSALAWWAGMLTLAVPPVAHALWAGCAIAWASNALGVTIAAPAMLSFIGQPAGTWRHRRGSVALPMVLATLMLGVAIAQIDRWQQHRASTRLERSPHTVEPRLTGIEDAIDPVHAVHVASHGLNAAGGRTWRVQMATPQDVAPLEDPLDGAGAARLWVAFVGAAAIGMLGALLLLVTGRTRRIESAVLARTRELEHEISERQGSEQALRESEQRFRNIIDSVPIGIVYTDLHGRIHQCNPQFARMLGRSEAELLGSSTLQYTHPDDIDEDQAQRDAVASGQLPIARRRKRLIRENADVLSVRFTMTLLRDAQGRPWRLVSAVEDITEHLRLEIAERARETAESANQAKSDFLSRMSHELRTPLNAMLGFGQLLELDRTEPLRERHRLWVVQIQQAGWHLLEMINDVLDLSRIESGTVSLQFEPLSVEKLIAASMGLVEPQAQANNVTINRCFAAHPPLRVRADSTRVKQILANLLSNAVKYNQPGGEVHVSTSVIELPDGQPQLRLDVRDTGIGMTPQQLSQLFQPFNRLGRERGTTEGTGIGLVIAKLLAERQGGSLEASSTPGQGSTFTLCLPLTEEASALTAAGELDAAESDYHLRHVLYIEDNETNVEVMRGIFLLRPQVQLDVAVTGLDGLAAVRTAPPDLVLLDMNLPDIDGMALLQHLQADERTSKIPVVVVSADALPALIAATLNAGATRYLTKPVSVDEVLGMLDDLLSPMTTRYG